MTVQFHVTPLNVNEHLFGVRCVVANPAAAGQVFTLPSWLRGSYLVRDFAKHVVSISAHAGGQPVAIERLDKRSLRCAPVTGPLELRYTVYAYDESVRKAWLDARRGFFNPSSLCYCPQGFENQELDLILERPRDPRCRDWRAITSLRALQIDADGFGRYRALDYEDLIDHPVELGRFERLDFEVDGIPHALVLSGRYELDRARVCRDLAAICRVERELFGQQPQLEQYLFLTNVVASGYGGLEHRSSTALICSRNDLPQPGDESLTKSYRSFLGLCSHEYFHLWNVKRITAQRFQESDLAGEAYTRDLWHYEGVTSYYDDLFLLRAGILDAQRYLDVVAETATRLERAAGRGVQTLEDASFEAWIKYYQPDENSGNATVSYYVKGALVALCLDLRLRRDSAITLDEVMRALWQRYGATGIGVPEGGLEQLAQSLSGLDLRDFFARALRSTNELPLIEALAEFGVQAERRIATGDSDGGGRVSAAALSATLGLRLRAGDTRVASVLSGGPAARSGISAGDQLVALDGLRVTAANWTQRLQALQVGCDYPLQLFRNDELLTLTVCPEAPPADTWTLTLMPTVNEAILARRQRWLGA